MFSSFYLTIVGSRLNNYTLCPFPHFVSALVKGAGRSVQFRQLQLYRHEMQHFVKVIQGYIANQILQVSWSEFTQKLSSASDLDAIHRTHAEYLNRAIFRLEQDTTPLTHTFTHPRYPNEAIS